MLQIDVARVHVFQDLTLVISDQELQHKVDSKHSDSLSSNGITICNNSINIYTASNFTRILPHLYKKLFTNTDEKG